VLSSPPEGLRLFCEIPAQLPAELVVCGGVAPRSHPVEVGAPEIEDRPGDLSQASAPRVEQPPTSSTETSFNGEDRNGER
jgi:hypothetical protein